MKLKNPKISLFGAIAFLAIALSAFLSLYNPVQKNFPKVSLFNSCSVDNINGAIKIGANWETTIGAELVAQGWSADKNMTTVPTEGVVQLLDESNEILQTWVEKYNFARPDVVKAYGNPAMGNSGFNIDIGKITKSGIYTLQIGSINKNINQLCSLVFQLKVNN